MKRTIVLMAIVVAIAGAFLAGRLVAPSRADGSGSGRKVLYWVDPMNPAFRSPEPGTAPCGMALEPVYEDEGEGAGNAASDARIHVDADRRQLVGVTVEPAAFTTVPYTLRLLGAVAVDETRLYQIGSISQGWVREVSSATSGTLVRKDEVLAKYYSQEAYNPQQAYIYALNALDRERADGSLSPEKGQPFERTIVNTRQTLLNVGMTQAQIDEIGRRREIDPLVEIRAPADGFILKRNVFLGQAFKPTSELYTVADLTTVWILADAFEADEHFLKPGVRARVSHPSLGGVMDAVVSDVLPEFDAATRTLKVRLEASNPGYVLRPGMFVDVEVPVKLGPALSVSRDAVLDSGGRQTVFIDRGGGSFEIRRVSTGWRYAGRVEITGGLMEGEKVVTSGNFLLDSESRMRAAAVEPAVPRAVDPVCGMDVDEDRARQGGLVSTHGGVTVFFCSAGCKERYEGDPAAYSGAGHQGAAGRAAPETAVDPVCGMTVATADARTRGLVSERDGKRVYFCGTACKEKYERNPAAYSPARP